MKIKADDYLVYDEATGKYHEDPEQGVRDDVEKHTWLNVARTVIKDWRLYLMLVPMLLVFLFWRYFPMYELLGAFKVHDDNIAVADQLYAGFSYFKMLFAGSDSSAIEFWRAFRNTFLLSFYGLLFGFPMPIIIALFFNEIRSNIVRSVYQVITYLPKFISTVVMTTLITMLVRQPVSDFGIDMGIISRLLVELGLITEETGTVGLLNDAGFFRAIYQISGIWETAGYDSIVFFAAIIAISPTSYEAAQIDGAGYWKQCIHVTIPGIMSTICMTFILSISGIVKDDFEQIYALAGEGGLLDQTMEVLGTWIYKSMHNTSNFYAWGEATAVGMVQSLIGMILVGVSNLIVTKTGNEGLW